MRNKYTNLHLVFVICNSVHFPQTTTLTASHNVYMLNLSFILLNVFINFP